MLEKDEIINFNKQQIAELENALILLGTVRRYLGKRSLDSNTIMNAMMHIDHVKSDLCQMCQELDDHSDDMIK